MKDYIKTRTNIKLIPTQQSIKNIIDFCKSVDINPVDFINDPHCTIVYSRDIFDVCDIKLPDVELPIVAENLKLHLFDSPDNGLVLVLIFESAVIKDLFNHIKSNYNLRTLFPEIIPHITLVKNLSSNELQDISVPISVMFDKLEMDNGD